MPRSVLRRFLLVLAVLLVTAPSLPDVGIAQGVSNAASACQQGGWAGLAPIEDPGISFGNQGECVSYAAHGGTLVSFAPGPDCSVGASWDGATSLAGMNFSGCDLSDTSLAFADLSNANLSGAYLYRADLSGATLAGANLSGAHLWKASLRGVNLAGADISGAAISEVDLTGANLSDATLHGSFTEYLDVTNAFWRNTTCPDGTNSDDDPSGTCEGHQ